MVDPPSGGGATPEVSAFEYTGKVENSRFCALKENLAGLVRFSLMKTPWRMSEESNTWLRRVSV